MKQSIVYFLLLGLLLNLSCKKEEVDEPITIPNGIIKSSSVADGQQNVGIYDSLLIVLNYPIEYPASIGDGKAITIKVTRVTLTKNGEEVPFDLEVKNKIHSDLIDSLRICPIDIFNENDGPYVLNLSFNVYHFEDKSLAKVISQTDFSYTFHTKQYSGAAGISESDIEQCYPAINQYHFLPKESTEGIIKLKPSKDICINTDRWEHFVKFYRKDGEIFSSPAQFDPSTNTFTFSTPQDLSVETIYSYALFQKPKGSTDATQITQVFKTYFRTSRFATFKEKWATFKPIRFYKIPLYMTIPIYGIDFTLAEELDACEEKAFIGLIRFSADTSDINYKDRKYMYDGLATSGYTLTNARRNPLHAVPPLNAIYVKENKEVLTQQQIEEDNAPAIAPTENKLRTDVYITLSIDTNDIDNQIWYKPEKDRNTYDNTVLSKGNYSYVLTPTVLVLDNTHAQYFVGDKMTSEVLFNWR